MPNFIESITISVIAMSVIFITLIMLILIIRILVSWWPYKVPPASAARGNKPEGTSSNPEHLAAIHASLAQYLDKTPDEIQLLNIKQL